MLLITACLNYLHYRQFNKTLEPSADRDSTLLEGGFPKGIYGIKATAEGGTRLLLPGVNARIEPGDPPDDHKSRSLPRAADR